MRKKWLERFCSQCQVIVRITEGAYCGCVGKSRGKHNPGTGHCNYCHYQGIHRRVGKRLMVGVRLYTGNHHSHYLARKKYGLFEVPRKNRVSAIDTRWNHWADMPQLMDQQREASEMDFKAGANLNRFRAKRHTLWKGRVARARLARIDLHKRRLEIYRKIHPIGE